MLISVFKVKPVIGFTDLHKNIVLCKANNFMYYTL